MSFQQYDTFGQQQQGGSSSPTGGNAPAGQVVPQQGQPSASPAPYNNGGGPPSGNGSAGDGSKTTLWYVVLAPSLGWTYFGCSPVKLEGTGAVGDLGAVKVEGLGSSSGVLELDEAVASVAVN